MTSISMESFKNIHEKNPVSLIDVRPEALYQENHIPGAVNISLEELENRLAELSPTDAHYIVCQRGVKSEVATALLTEKGFDATNVEGGTLAWKI
ncbi:rhodanese-like domain-containing protein [Streptococcus moroccensis]|uniref:Rhodanese-related sulfurtransferase n=1 Tax=Streptococcus moroccensis TaxID=1451356 RepID=A0ABT9YU62_9STRE|nr:rhodanese-like domain-containing protein [Streptococcus moroccensis]MDQ0223539.1 rhodanese-related sulfurtransferase [Streptococcus moroccensis]